MPTPILTRMRTPFDVTFDAIQRGNSRGVIGALAHGSAAGAAGGGDGDTIGTDAPPKKVRARSVL